MSEADYSRDWPGGDYATEAEAPDELAPEPDAEEVAQADAEHERFLESYAPVITRMPQALEDEASERAEQLKVERVQTLVRDLGISEDEAREQVYGPDVSAENQAAFDSLEAERLAAPGDLSPEPAPDESESVEQ